MASYFFHATWYRRKGDIVAKALQTCKNDFLLLHKGILPVSKTTGPDIRPFPLMLRETREMVQRDELVTHGIRQQAPRTSEVVQGDRKSH